MEDHSISAYESTIKYIEEYLQKDRQYKDLSELLNVKSSGAPTVSGLSEVDYPATSEHVGGELSVVKNSPLPNELLDKFAQMQRNCLMGLFPEGRRVWLTIDNEIFVWNYDDGTDLAYYDGLNDTIICVGFVKPKPGVFHRDIHYLLCLATPVELLLLGVTLVSQDPRSVESSAMQLLPDPLHSVATDNQTVCCIEGTPDGRVFLGTRNGSVLEVVYGSKTGWFSLGFSSGKSCSLVNHSSSTLSILLPSILTLGLKEEDSLVQLCIDPGRQLVYTRSEHSTLTVYSLGDSYSDGAAQEPSTPGGSLRRLATLTEGSLVSRAGSSARSVDKSQLGSLVHLVSLPISKGPLQMMAVNQAGIRFYFTEGLRLAHVRVPPPNAAIPRIGQVRLAAESRGTVVLVSSRNEDTDVLYTLSPDPFPWSGHLAESCFSAWPPGRAWVLLPIMAHSQPPSTIVPHLHRVQPPVVITQHVDPVRRFLLVSAQGLVHLELQAPLHRLIHLLEVCPAPDSPEISQWFYHYGPDEAVYAALVLASGTHDDHLADKAKQAVFLHCATTFANTAAGPVSPIHKGLAVYAARILRPLWDSSIVEKTVVAKDKTFFLVSKFDSEELSWFLHHLHHLQAFIRESLAQLKAAAPFHPAPAPQPTANPASMTPQQQRPGLVTNGNIVQQVGPGGTRPAIDMTGDLLDLLYLTVEVIGLWKLLTEHQFYLVARRLPADLQEQLVKTTLKQLLSPSNRHLLMGLIAGLLEHYLYDGASVAAISSKLQDVCPSLFGNEDVLCARANELLSHVVRSRTDQQPPLTEVERRKILVEAVSIYQDVGPNLDLGIVLPRLREVGCYDGIIQLCLVVAQQRDPEGRALVFLKEGHRPHSDQEIALVDGRYDAYRRLIETLDHLLELSVSEHRHPLKSTSSSPSPLPRYPGDIHPHSPPPPASTISSVGSVTTITNNSVAMGDGSEVCKKARSDLHRVLADIFTGSSDILVHYEVLRWLQTNQMTEDILSCQSPNLESYLRNRLRQSPEDLTLRDLLWRHCEAEGKRLEAARVLEHLAVAYCENVRLTQRIEYLTRAIVCVKALTGLQNEGDYLHDLEDKLEIACLQREVAQELRAKYSIHSQDLVSALEHLEVQLFNLTSLFTQFADQFQLSVSKLSILRAAGHQEPQVVEGSWEEILDTEFREKTTSDRRQLSESALRDSLARLADKFKDTPAFFPLELIVLSVESHSNQHKFSVGWGVSCFEAMRLDIPKLIYAYDRVLKSKNHECQQSDFKKHMFAVMLVLLEKFLQLADSMHPRPRQMHSSQFLDLISSYMVELSSSGDPRYNILRQKMQHLKEELKRLT